MSIFNTFKYDPTAINFNKKVTDAVFVLFIILGVPLIFYINFFRGKSGFHHPISIISNYLVLILLLVVTIWFKKIPYLIKRLLIFIVLSYYGINAFLLGNLEFMSSILVILVSFTFLTSNSKVSVSVLIISILLYMMYPILYQYNIVSFYYDPIMFHSDISIIIIRIIKVLIGLIFMSGLIYVVFMNNKANIALLEEKVREASYLNRTLQQEIAGKEIAEILAKEYARNYLTLFNNSYDGYMLLSSDYQIKDVNQAICNISGYQREEIVGLNSQHFLGEEYKEILDSRRDAILNGIEVPDLIIDVKNKAGERLILLSQIVVIHESSDYSYLAVLKDVTKQRIATEQLAKSEQVYRTLFEQTNDAILIMNDNDIVEFNKVAKKLYADRGENQIILPPYVHPEQKFEEPNDLVNLPDKIERALAGEPQFFEWVHVFGKEESPVYTLVNLQEIKLLGENHYMVVEKDITTRKMNQNLILNSIIETEENERKRISSDLHDGIGPLLTTIKLYTQALLDTKEEDKQLVIKEKLGDLIEDAVNSVSEISFNISPHILLNYGIIAAVNSFIEKFNLDEKLKIIFTHSDLGRFSENKEITIYRLFTELVNNTLKHAKATEIAFRISESKNNIVLSYVDNGIGFDPEKVRLSKKGMGLGNLKSRIQSFNGLFSMKSKPGEGVVVKIKIPIQDI